MNESAKAGRGPEVTAPKREQKKSHMESLIGIRFTDWMRLLWENRFAVDRPYWNRAGLLTLLSLRNSLYARRERKLFAERLEHVTVKPPLFILGHWRSGTTLIHTLLSLDNQFAFPNLFQISKPHVFLSREQAIEQALGADAAHRRPMDDIKITFKSPGEDEGALAVASLRSPLLGWTFPRREEFYDRYLTFRDVPKDELDGWKRAFMTFLKKLTFRYNRAILLKSPTHTARIRLLLEMFPEARFVHVHRNPYAVFQSTVRLYQTELPDAYLQRPPENFENGILRRYTLMYDAFFEERKLIPEGRYCEVSFEKFEQDKVGGVEEIYRSLCLDGFEQMKPALEEHVKSIASYKKNTHPPLDDSLRERIARSWKRAFEEWGYAVGSRL